MVAEEVIKATRQDSDPAEQANTSREKNTVVRTTKGSETSVLKSISVWLNKPHVVNRRLCGTRILSAQRFGTREGAIEALEKLKTNPDEVVGDAESNFSDLSEETESYLLLMRELIPKSEFFPNVLEAVLYDKEAKTVRFTPVRVLDDRVTESGQAKLKTEELEYTVCFREEDENLPVWSQVNELVLTWSPDLDPESSGVRRQVTSQWLGSVLLDKLVNWSQVDDLSTSATSLQLVSVDKYKETYIRLKNTYGRDLVKNWTERTDPKKFVYEDLAIAAYLMLIWEEDREKKQLHHKQTFVDLGCGNGLLVYILTKEGHKGLGIDLKKRKIWDTFGPGIDLREETITPSADHLFPEYDWIIGNHSDELTPWIPVIAARSSYQCSLFVLPCCHHDFVGKFNHPSKAKSLYGAYLDHVKDIIANCGFHPESDTLRIPSTKRVCFLGRSRAYEEKMEPKVDRDRQSFIDKRIEMAKRMSWGAGKPGRGSKDGGKKLLTKTIDGHSEEPSKRCTEDCEEELTTGQLRTKGGFVDRELSIDSGLGSWGGGSGGSQPSDDDVLMESQTETEGEDRKDPQAKGSNTEMNCLSSIGLRAKRRSCSDPVDIEEHNVDKKVKCDETTTSDMVAVQADLLKGAQWASEFKPRVDPGIRNCQRVPEETKRNIVEQVFKIVLEANVSSKVKVGESQHWSKGGSVHLRTVVTSLGVAKLQDLKSECGGLQTLLRNHSHIFQVTRGMVRLRDFSQADPWQGRKVKKVGGQVKDKRKTMPCWFFSHHPDGCPRDSSVCSFAHGSQELRAK